MAEEHVRLDDLRLSFPTPAGPLPVLDGVSATIGRGEFVSIIGPSGCGKSTLFNSMAGLLQPDTGRLLIDDIDRTSSTAHCGYMPQQDLLFPWRTIAQNAALGLEVQGVPRREARQRARDLLPEFGLGGFEDARPSELSGGMRQRVALARTVLQERDVLLLDEPLGALDALTRTEMQDWLQRVWSRHRRTVIMVTHDVREATYLSDRILVLGPRPTRIVKDVTVRLARPRTIDTLTDPEFLRVEALLLRELRGDGSAGPRASNSPATT